MIPLPAYDGADVGVLGLGSSGLAAARAFEAAGARVHVWDDRPQARRGLASPDLPEFDLPRLARLVWSPGVPHLHPRPHALARRAAAAGVEPVADTAVLAEAMAGRRFLAVTGTNGKSTVTALVAHALEALGIEHAAGGNLGPPALGLPTLGPDGIYLLELSSYQLELTPEPSFGIAALLNIDIDHLDRHGGLHRYAAQKIRVFARAATAVVGTDDAYGAWIARRLEAEGVRVIPVGAADGPALPHLPGAHNRQNAAAALAMLTALGIDRGTALAAMEGFRGLPHRLETVAKIGGVAYINDSKATNPASAARALASFRRIRWIAGGRAKAEDLEALRHCFPRIARAYLIGESGEMFAAALGGDVPWSLEGTLERAVAAAHRDAGPGEVVLLSPAAASFDQWANFEARGDAFRAAARALAGAER